jgi:hypothetical protein
MDKKIWKYVVSTLATIWLSYGIIYAAAINYWDTAVTGSQLWAWWINSATTAINWKEPAITAWTTSQYLRWDKT